MQLPLPADVLFPLGIGAIVAVVAVVALVLGLRSRADDTLTPTHADWTGENVGAPARPAAAQEAAPKRTVADAIAARRADTDPFPVVPQQAVVVDRSVAFDDPALEPLDVAEVGDTPPAPAGAAAAGDVTAHPTPASDCALPVAAEKSTVDGSATQDGSDLSAGAGRWPTSPAALLSTEHPAPGSSTSDGPVVGGAAGCGPSGVAGPGLAASAAHAAPERSAAGGGAAAPEAQSWAAAGPGAVRPASHAAPDPSAAVVHGPADPGPEDPDTAGTSIPKQASVAAGSSRTVAAAVAHVLAARAAAPGADRRGDARDRLLAVLLDDPLRAVGAAVDLLDCQERMDRLAGALNEERGRLRDVLSNLARSGLRADQLARLSGLTDADVADLLRRNIH